MADSTGAPGAAGSSPTGGQGAGEGQKAEKTGGQAPQPAAPAADKPQGGGEQGGRPKKVAPIPETPEQKEAREKRERSKTKRENLLGFNTRGVGDDDFPDLIGEERAKSGEGPAERDPKTGQFLPRKGEAGAKGNDGQGAPPKPAGSAGEGEQPVAAPPKPGEQPSGDAGPKIKFLGKEVSVAEAEQTHRSLQGMFKTLNDEKASLTKERAESWDVAWQWKREHDKVAERLAAYERGGVPANTGAAAASAGGSGGNAPANGGAATTGKTPSVEELADAVDGDAFEAIAKKFGVSHAVRYLASEMLKTITEKVLPAERERVAAEMQEIANKPAQETAALKQVDGMIRSVGALKDARGGVAFPEVNDGEKLEQIGRVWAAYGNDPRQIFNSGGLIAAVGLYRTHLGLSATEPVTGPVTETTIAAAGPDPATAANLAASVPANGGPQSRPVPANMRGLSPAAQRFVSSLERVDMRGATSKGVDLGFARNTRASR